MRLVFHYRDLAFRLRMVDEECVKFGFHAFRKRVETARSRDVLLEPAFEGPLVFPQQQRFVSESRAPYGDERELRS